jgi:hypothetical protein
MRAFRNGDMASFPGGVDNAGTRSGLNPVRLLPSTYPPSPFGVKRTSFLFTFFKVAPFWNRSWVEIVPFSSHEWLWFVH